MANRVLRFRLGIMLRFRVLSASFSTWDRASFSSLFSLPGVISFSVYL